VKAIVYTEFGPPEVLKQKEVEKPDPKDNEVLVKVSAVGVTVGDCRMRAFNVPFFFKIPAMFMFGFTKPKKPILGGDFAGEVEKVGKDVKNFTPGDLVFGSTGFTMGAYAEYLVLPEKGAIAIKPSDISFEEAASIAFGACTALYFLRDLCPIQPGQRALVNGASGAVGTAAVQLAKHYGAEVTGVCSGPNAELVKSLGADAVIDYTKEDFTAGDARYDVIATCNGYHPISDYLRVLNPGGKYLMIGGEDKQLSESILWGAWHSWRTGKKVFGGSREGSEKDIRFMKELIAAGTYRPVLDRTYPLGQIVEAHRYVDEGHKKGNVVITLGHNDKT
jgi:NADPH:quinone reductase-like Zn-dependent oxidoreductase